MSVALSGHKRIDQRSLELHRVIAEKLRRNPELLAVAKENLQRWTPSAGRSQSYLDRWREILDGPFEELLATMVLEDGARGRPSPGVTFRRHPATCGTVGNLPSV